MTEDPAASQRGGGITHYPLRRENAVSRKAKFAFQIIAVLLFAFAAATALVLTATTVTDVTIDKSYPTR